MRKKFFMALLLAALVIVLAACNRGDDTDENGYENGSVVGGGTDAHELHGIFERDGVPANWVPGPEWTRAHVLANMPEFTPTGSVNWADGTTATINMLYGWDNIAVNARARRLMWEYNNTMESNMDREFFPNPMVTQNIVTQSDQYFPGTRTYTFTIYTENQWSDGRFITAHDYVGWILLTAHPYFDDIRISNPGDPHIVGRTGWDGTTGMSGVRVYGDNSFSVTVWYENDGRVFLPYVWEQALYMNYQPMPLHAMIPNFNTQVQVADTPEGAMLTGLNRDLVATGINGVESMQRRTDDDGEYVTNDDGEYIYDLVGGTGFRFQPTVASGPYRFVSLDPSSFTMILQANPYFVGTWDGFRPRIQTVIFSQHNADVVIDALASGEADMVASQGQGQVINNMFDTLVAPGTHTFESYPRNGYGLIRFHVDHGPTQFTEVRQAVKWLIDRDEFMQQFTLGHGTVNHGPYGSAQWWTIAAIDRGMYERITMYGLNPANAVAALEAGGWVLNAQGGDFVLGEGNRFKDVTNVAQLPNALPFADDPMVTTLADGRMLMELDIQWATWNADANRITEIIEILVVDELLNVGIGITPHRVANPLVELSRAGDYSGPQFHMFNQGTTFALVWAPWYTHDPALHGSNNIYYTSDPAIFAASSALRVGEVQTQAGRDAFVDAFIEMIVVLNREVIEIPLYVDEWFDFVPVWLGNWHNASQWGGDFAIVRAYDGR